jgi:hypothetical protein
MELSWAQRDQVPFSTQASQGYVTYDGTLSFYALLTLDFGSDGDDTYHTPYPNYDIPLWVQSTLVPKNISDDDIVDLIFTNFSSWGVFALLLICLTSDYQHFEFLRSLGTFV